MKKILETERLILREFVKDDIGPLAEILSDPETMAFYPRPFSSEGVARWIDWNMESYKEFGQGLWAVILKKGDIFIGDCGITMQDIEGKDLPEIGYHINRKFWGNGYAPEAAKACLDFGFRVLGYPSLYSYMDMTNLPSRRVAEKIGMSFRESFKKDVMGAKDIEEALYEIDRGAWERDR